ncbi:MAG: ATPase, T2SS/T4P/T4SS family [Acidobacteriota bacterium]
MPMDAGSESRVGELLVKEGLLAGGDLDAALKEQRSRKGYVPLGRILIERGLVTQKQLTLVLERNDKRPRLGELLVRNGSLTQERLDEALKQQRIRHRPLGELLVTLGFITDEEMRQALGIQLNIPYLDLDRIDIDRGLARLINRNYARRHLLVPVSFVGAVLTVSINDPTNRGIVDDLSRSTGFMVNLVTSSQDSIKRAFQKMYGDTIDTAPPVEAADPSDHVDDVDGDQGGSPTQRRRAGAAVRHIVALAIERGSSDIHIEQLAGRLQIRFRLDGMLQELPLGPVQQMCEEHPLEIVSRIKILGKLDIAERRRPQDGAFRTRVERNGQMQKVDVRISIVPGYYGESVVLRILDKIRVPKSIEEVGFSPAVTAKLLQLVRRPAGMLLITGPTGSGKSTTMYAALQSVYRPEIRILTAEDPIEYVYEQFSQSEVNERIGNTFARYLRAFLRHDPEVIMIGEIRDQETAEMAFRAAQTGHLLLSTLHTNDALSTVTRLRDMNVDANLLASSLLGVLSQRLVRAVCSDCREPYRPSPELMQEFFPSPPDDMPFYRGAGCDKCSQSGYRGRLAVAELWTPDQEDVILVSKGAPPEEIRASAQRSTVSMVQDVWARLVAGRTNLEELIRTLPYSTVFQFRQAVAAGTVMPRRRPWPS